MSAHHVDTLWMGGMQFNSLVNGHTVVLDAPERAGGHNEGPIPKPLLLTALTGCTGMDVVALLRKQGVTLQSLELSAEGELTKTAPLMYQSIHLLYNAHSEHGHQQALLEAVLRSQNELCGVNAMLKKAAELSFELRFNGQCLTDTRPVAAAMQEVI